MPAIEFLDANQHQQLKHHHQGRFKANMQRHCLPITLNEFVIASASLPVVFIKDADTGQFRSCVMTGLKAGQNLCTDGEQWFDYEPKVMWHQPLLAVANPNDSRHYNIAIERSQSQINQTEGELLFVEGQASPYLVQLSQAAIQWQVELTSTQQFIQRLLQLSLLEPKVLTVQGKNAAFDVTGCYMINTTQLNALPADEFLSLRKDGYLAAIYASLASQSRVDTLIARFNALQE